ncbi:MAG: NHLP family bacteriocin export ABC transporter peptidase/permease/ATPase subunit [Planctomycetota bacterium]|nr:MAG: NHLP family bacteriocin export ABC transporter peptidase/permease/ATPase subunit [Planctomycetota bacterium]REJ91406.1 MAG: NHLP family bacteriocin export ABC transporter peptidase/permease/ATPase subunit [Planctomycetota bacterium]REK18474.1 MAG: NHLP family bacteriocin export ABC transporter peptidase/permease/ATPase subunit [Planctomycetota bacterium]REK39465.1 MAG: NHLP family bacteriocin export ABC transporter peptidase/permease/ATPase subunit [Planctomycetota bacterium]
MEAVECGAAALGIVLGYFGRFVPLAELREKCGVSRDGSKASNVVKAARLYGMEAKGFSKTLESVREMATPFIAFWQFNHFLVVEGHDRKNVYLNDPASGHRTVSWDDFNASFTGVVLAMSPGKDFQQAGRPPGITGRLWRRMQGNLATLLFIAIAGLAMILPGLAIPAFSRVFIDSVIVDARFDWYRPLLIAMAGTVAIKVLLEAVQQFHVRRLRLSMAARMNSQFFRHLLRLPVSFYTQRFPGEIVSRMELNDKLASVVAGQLASIVINLFTMIVYGAVLLLIHWPLTLIATGFALANLVYLRWVGRHRIEANLRYSQEAGKASGFVIAGIQSIETMKASGMEDDFFGKWMGYYAKSSNAGQELQYSALPTGSLPILVDSLTTVLVLIIGGYSVIQGNMTIGTLVAFQGLMATYLAPVASLTEMGSTLQELRGDLMRLDDVLANPTKPTTRPAAGPDGNGRDAREDAGQLSKHVDGQADGALPAKLRLDGQVELRNVTFGYSPLEPPLIQDLSLVIRPGERVALVGGSGSGKSTVAKLVCGLYQPWSGEVLFDGQPRDTLAPHVLSQSLALVEQDIMMFEASIRDNLTLWDATVKEASLERACEDAHIHDVVANLPGTFAAKLQEGGANLSGGQRQRLEIARALVNDPSILVMDEGTSALDAETEAIIDTNLRRRGCTCVIVAHRLSTIRDANEIIVLERGAVVERGTHEQLWDSGGHYAALLKHHDEVATAS